jgi:hypothetical protein
MSKADPHGAACLLEREYSAAGDSYGLNLKDIFANSLSAAHKGKGKVKEKGCKEEKNAWQAYPKV